MMKRDSILYILGTVVVVISLLLLGDLSGIQLGYVLLNMYGLTLVICGLFLFLLDNNMLGLKDDEERTEDKTT